MRLAANRFLLALLLASVGLGPGCRRGQTTVPPAQTKTSQALTYQGSNGQMLYEHYCAVCHGTGGAGDGFNAYNLRPVQPRNFTDAEAMKQLSDQDLFTAISRGGRAMGRSPLMPAWGSTLNERQVRYLVRYLRTLSTQPRS